MQVKLKSSLLYLYIRTLAEATRGALAAPEFQSRFLANHPETASEQRHGGQKAAEAAVAVAAAAGGGGRALV